MSVLIKGMEMPKSCDKCELMTANYGCAFVGAVGGESYRKRAWDCPLVEAPKWIPVTERLPKCNGCYLVWRPHFFGGEIGMPSICYFDGSNTWHDSYGVDFERILHPKDVTHWMPLPEPPESDDSLSCGIRKTFQQKSSEKRGKQ